MAKLIHVKGSQVKAASAKFEKLLRADPDQKRELDEHKQREKAEKARRDKEFAATRPGTD